MFPYVTYRNSTLDFGIYALPGASPEIAALTIALQLIFLEYMLS